jgi:hypothetical protein
MIVVLSRYSAQSMGVLREIEYFRELGKPIIPVVIEPCEIPESLRNLQIIDFTHDIPRAMEHMVESVLRAVEPLRGAPSEDAPGPTPSQQAAPTPEAPAEAVPDWLTAFDPTSEAAEGGWVQDEVPVAEVEEVLAAEPADVMPDWMSESEVPLPAAEPADVMSVGALSTRPHFSAFYPGVIKKGQPYALMAFVHLESAWEKVREIAAGYAGMMSDQQQNKTAPSRIAVDVGSLITFVPCIPGLKFDPPEQAVTWQPPHQASTFLFTTPADLSAGLTGAVRVYQGPLIIGEIPISMKLVAKAVSVPVELNKHGEFHRFDPVFASYSHRDTPVMEYFRGLREKTGQKMLVDIYDLRSGEHWADRLLEMIDQSAAFQLFWSKHSAGSKYCRQEWEHALACADSRPRFIQPVFWDKRLYPAPPELADLHFQKIPLPPLTRAQLAAARVRAVLRRG